MNSKILVVFLILLILQIGCKQTTEPASTNMFVSFDVQSAFQNDSVKVALNNEIMLEARVTTNYTISLA